MKRFLLSFIALGIFALFFLISSQEISAQEVSAEYVEGEVLVKYKDNTSAEEISLLHSSLNSVSKRSFKKLNIQQMTIPDYMSVEEAVHYFEQDPNVEYAEPNYIVHTTATPNDTSYSNLWGLHNTGQTIETVVGTTDADIDAPVAWDTETGDFNIGTGEATTIVAVVDTGVDYNHPDFRGTYSNIWINSSEIIDGSCTDNVDNNSNGRIDECAECGNSTDDDGNGYVDDCRGWDFVDDDNDPMDYADHGTHVAGTIAAYGNNSLGITGVMWRASIMPIRFLDTEGSGTTANAISAILYANAKGAHVINNSWGGGGSSQALKEAIDASSAVVVCAAGNSGTDNDSAPFYPASYSSTNLVSVAATNNQDGLASFSNYGDITVDLGAPGVSIYSTIPARKEILTDNFDDGDISASSPPEWTLDGSWGLTDLTAYSDDYSLTDSPGASTDYSNTTDTSARSPSFALTDETGCRLRYRLRIDILPDDYFYIQASTDASTWTTLGYYTNVTTSDDFAQVTEDLTAYDGEATLYIQFRLVTDASTVDDGVYIDDVYITCSEPADYTGTVYQFFSGTSMAAPHVSGAAGLIKSYKSTATAAEMKDAVMYNSDYISALDDKTASENRLNIEGIFTYIDCAPSGLSASKVNSQTNLSWTDNCGTEDGFKIERKTSAANPFAVVATIATPNTTTYSDTDTVVSQVVYYRIRAYNSSSGNYGVSNESSVSGFFPSPSWSKKAEAGCFIATAAYGSLLHPYVKALRDFRDSHLLTNSAGRAFVELYYKYSPPAADVIRTRAGLRFATRLLLAPLVMSVVYPLESFGLLLSITAISIFVMRRKKTGLGTG